MSEIALFKVLRKKGEEVVEGMTKRLVMSVAAHVDFRRRDTMRCNVSEVVEVRNLK